MKLKYLCDSYLKRFFFSFGIWFFKWHKKDLETVFFKLSFLTDSEGLESYRGQIVGTDTSYFLKLKAFLA